MSEIHYFQCDWCHARNESKMPKDLYYRMFSPFYPLPTGWRVVAQPSGGSGHMCPECLVERLSSRYPKVEEP